MHGTWEPEPAARWEDAFLAGNGRHGALVFGDPADDRLVVTHHTLVRPVPRGDTLPPRLASGLEGLRDRLLAGDTAAGEAFTDGRGLRWVGAFHPAFAVRLRRPGPGGAGTAGEAGTAGGVRGVPAGYRRDVDFTTGVVRAECAGRASRSFVSRADDVIVQYVTGAPLDAHITLDPDLPGAPAGLAVGRGVVPAPDGALLTLRARHPGGEESFTGVTLVVAAGGTTAVDGDGVRVTGAREALLLTRVRRHTGDADARGTAAALRALLAADASPGDASPEGTPPGDAYRRLLARHESAHRTAYERVALDLGGLPEERALPGSALLRRPESAALLERLFAAGRYHLLSSSGMLPPRLVGLWTGDWDTAWSGAFTTNANLNLQTASAAAAALPEVTEAHAAFVYGQLPDWRDNAREVFGTRGVVAPSHTDGTSGHAYHFRRDYPLHVWTAGADWLLVPLVEHAETTGATDPRLVAALAEVARFYEDFLTRTGPDGRVVVVPSYSPENRPANAGWVTLDATMDIAAARHALTTAADHLPDDADRLRALAARLPDYRINDDGALAEWAWPGLADRYDHRHLSHLYPVWPLHEITPYDTPALARAAHRALELRGAENDSAHGHLHHALVAARLRDGDRAAAALGRVLRGDFFHASLMSAHYPGRDVYNADAAHALPALLVELLVQSTPERLVLLPALPEGWTRGALSGVRTRCGARVDLEWRDGTCTASIRPSRSARIDLRTPAGGHPLELTAGEDLVLTLRTG
ncbi:MULTISPECIES: glycosyl hydrolase family 95 catalytic domain-containing protein [Streptomyces]|uniref:Alpha-L-fucosidase n=2 Tax=Streptomyces TaxID=1883 RepID=A0A100Y9A1_9ACTN|nr:MULTISPECIES: glycoside hydrolase N-terminal domain-containing protein [Streptomyces]KUH40050.1 alpha-L-fucosidase [Streptomyces kanasensis]UUS34654.1 glycoside hydrolase family 95 protein [Streptomyces changanensis]